MPLRAILAPYDKTGLVDLGRGLESLSVEMYATGNTQPTRPGWNYDGLCNNAVQRVRVTVGP